MSAPASPFVSRAGIKLAHALDVFAPTAPGSGDPGARVGGGAPRPRDGLPGAAVAGDADPRGLRCADFGCNKGGFTDCLLQRGAASVIAIDTGYGALDWKLRNDPRVIVRERTNALHAEPPPEGVDLVVIDLAWTPQRHSIPAALKWIAASPRGRIITLVKPHYELQPEEKSLLRDGFLSHDEARRVAARVESEMPALGARVLGTTESPITGGKTARARGGQGNFEALFLLMAG